MQEYDYGSAIHAGFDYLLKNYPEVFVLGQGCGHLGMSAIR